MADPDVAALLAWARDQVRERGAANEQDAGGPGCGISLLPGKYESIPQTPQGAAIHASLEVRGRVITAREAIGPDSAWKERGTRERERGERDGAARHRARVPPASLPNRHPLSIPPVHPAVCFTVPPAALLTAARASASHPHYGPAFAALALPDRDALCLALLAERCAGGASPWAPYVAALPAAYDDPTWWGGGDAALLAGSRAGASAACRRSVRRWPSRLACSRGARSVRRSEMSKLP